jgi:hypothetical protein
VNKEAEDESEKKLGNKRRREYDTNDLKALTCACANRRDWHPSVP